MVFGAESSNPKIGPSKFLLGYICLFFILFFLIQISVFGEWKNI